MSVCNRNACTQLKNAGFDFGYRHLCKRLTTVFSNSTCIRLSHNHFGTIGICRKGSFKASQSNLTGRNLYACHHLSVKFCIGHSDFFCKDRSLTLCIYRINGNNHFGFISIQCGQNNTLAFTDILILQSTSYQCLFIKRSAYVRPVVGLHRIILVGIQRKFGIFDESRFLVDFFVLGLSGFRVRSHISLYNRPNHILGALSPFLHLYIHRESGKVLDFKFHQFVHQVLILEDELLDSFLALAALILGIDSQNIILIYIDGDFQFSLFLAGYSRICGSRLAFRFALPVPFFRIIGRGNGYYGFGIVGAKSRFAHRDSR